MSITNSTWNYVRQRTLFTVGRVTSGRSCPVQVCKGDLPSRPQPAPKPPVELPIATLVTSCRPYVGAESHPTSRSLSGDCRLTQRRRPECHGQLENLKTHKT